MKRATIASIALIVIFGAFGNYLRYSHPQPDRGPNFSDIPLQLNGYSGEERRFDSGDYQVLKADTSTLRLYHDPAGTDSWLFVAYFSSQKYGSQIHSPKHCLPGGGWQIAQHDEISMPITKDHPLSVNRLLIANGGRRQLMFYWFETRSGTITNEFGLKFDLARNSLMLRPTDAAFVRYTLPIEAGDSIEGVTEKATEFLTAFQPSIMQSLPFSS